MQYRFRKGNDIEVRWRVNIHEGDSCNVLDLTSLDLGIQLTNGRKVYEIEDAVIEGNLITFVFPGSRQEYDGVYVAKLYDKGNGSITYDVMNAFTLTEHSWMEGDCGCGDGDCECCDDKECCDGCCSGAVEITSDIQAARIVSVTGGKQDYSVFVYKKSDSKPEKPSSYTPLPSGWVKLPEGDGTWWMCTAVVDGSSDTVKGGWSDPIKMTGKDGKDGEDGEDGSSGNNGNNGQSSFKSFVYKRSNTSLPAPTGGSFSNPVPEGWSDGIPEGDEQLWMSTRIFTSDGLYPQQASWTTPQPVADTADIDFEFSNIPYNPGNPTDNPGNWHNEGTEKDIWMAIRRAKNGTWGTWEIVKIKGEHGESSFTSHVFKRSTEKPAKPTGGTFVNPVPAGWEDGIPNGELQVWMSTRIFSTDGKSPQQDEWTEPRPITDTSDIDFEFSSKEVDPGNPTSNSENWHDERTEDSVWMAVRKKSNGVWGEWKVTKIRGENGESSFTSHVFKRSTDKPAKPTGGSYAYPVPEDWKDGIPDGELQVWMSTRIFSTDGNHPQQAEWSEPEPVTDTSDIDFEFSSEKKSPGNPTSNPEKWHNDSTEDDIWMAVRKKRNGVWSEWKVTKIKGENGIDGKTGPSMVFRGKYEADTLYYGNDRRIDVVKDPETGNYFMSVPREEGMFNSGNSGGRPSISLDNDTYWIPFGASYESVATALLFTEQATIENAIIRILKTDIEGVGHPRIEAEGNRLSVFNKNDQLRIVMTGDDIFGESDSDDDVFATAPSTIPISMAGFTTNGIEVKDISQHKRNDEYKLVNFSVQTKSDVTVSDIPMTGRVIWGMNNAPFTYFDYYKLEICSQLNNGVVASIVDNGSLGDRSTTNQSFSISTDSGHIATVPAGSYYLKLTINWWYQQTQTTNNNLRFDLSVMGGTIKISANGGSKNESDEQIIRIGADGMLMSLGASFVAKFRMSETNPLILLQGKSSAGKTNGLRIDKNGVYINRGEGYTAL